MNQTLKVSGMTCGHCAHAVHEELSQIDGVSDVDVQLVPGEISTVVIQTSADIPADAIRAALSEAGHYHLA